jgi:hypothetical protein
MATAQHPNALPHRIVAEDGVQANGNNACTPYLT